ncbi:hypothetical protein NC653_031911 [Populus alba x Populus x berolinensis]|uniref:Uncharacterized protein n=1 Tax=Populus alba x Populus x berolinensis TaxID=444605 RepID=A0AAD6Q414_9ROSI|nr:hypothetical protein NC653_031911 [Populus alba x Populus x berolinensis]
MSIELRIANEKHSHPSKLNERVINACYVNRIHAPCKRTSTNPKIKLQLSRDSAGKTNLVLPLRRKNHRIPKPLSIKQPQNILALQITKSTRSHETTQINLQKAQQPKDSSTREITKQH